MADRGGDGVKRHLRRAARLLAVVVAVASVLLMSERQAIAAAPPPATPATAANAKKQEDLVNVEDIRLRSTFARFGILTRPTVVQTQGSLPTLLLPARAAQYTASDLAAAGALTSEVDGSALLTMNVVVGPKANLVMGGSGFSTLRLTSGPAGFVSLTSWRGGIQLAGLPSHPLTVVAWDVQNLAPDTDVNDGRAYVRTMGGHLVLRDAKVSDLGFWSGRTGGVAWTGSKGEPSSGGSATSTFTGNAYGIYISGADSVQIINVQVEGNLNTGLAVHRNSVNTLVSGAAATGNYGDGFVIDRASQTRLMRSTSTDNGGDGIVLDGRGVGLTKTAGGVQVNQAKGTLIQGNTAIGNRGFGIRILGGQDTVVRGNTVDAASSAIGIVVKSGASGTQVVGNTVRGAAKTSVQVGSDAKTTLVDGNTLVGAKIGVVGENATGTTVTGNAVSEVTQFAITMRGPSTGAVISGNTLAGVGFRPIDIRKATGVTAAAAGHNSSGAWVFRVRHPWYALFQQHPALLVWLFVAVMLFFGWTSARRAARRPLTHPYPETDLLVRRGRYGGWNTGIDDVPPARTRAPAELVAAGAWHGRELAAGRVPVPYSEAPTQRISFTEAATREDLRVMPPPNGHAPDVFAVEGDVADAAPFDWPGSDHFAPGRRSSVISFEGDQYRHHHNGSGGHNGEGRR